MTNNSTIQLIPLNFDDLTPYKEEFKYAGVTYELREANAGPAAAFRNKCLQETKLVDGKVSGIGNMADTELYLVSLCVFEKLSTPGAQGATHRAITVDTVKGWPCPMVLQLYDRIRDVSNLKEEETPESLKKQIKALQDRLETLERGADPSPKDSQNSTTGTSG